MANKKGFSLIELLLVLSLAPIVFFAVYSNFSSGVRLWKRIQFPTRQEDVLIFHEKIVKDFKNILRYKTIPFIGEEDQIEFAAIIEADKDLGGERGLGWVSYTYHAAQKALVRESRNISQTFKEAKGQTSVLLQGISPVEFSFLVLNQTSHEYEWVGSFSGKNGDVPSAVRVNCQMEGVSNPVSQTFFIPVGWSGKDTGQTLS